MWRGWRSWRRARSRKRGRCSVALSPGYGACWLDGRVPRRCSWISRGWYLKGGSQCLTKRRSRGFVLLGGTCWQIDLRRHLRCRRDLLRLCGRLALRSGRGGSGHNLLRMCFGILHLVGVQLDPGASREGYRQFGSNIPILRSGVAHVHVR